MKQHLLPKQVLEVTKEQFYSLFPDDQHSVDRLVDRKDYATFHHKKMTIGKLIKTIRIRNQLQIYTVDNVWCVQLFESHICANDEVDCIWENSSKELVDVLWQAVKEALGFTEGGPPCPR